MIELDLKLPACIGAVHRIMVLLIRRLSCMFIEVINDIEMVIKSLLYQPKCTRATRGQSHLFIGWLSNHEEVDYYSSINLESCFLLFVDLVSIHQRRR